MTILRWFYHHVLQLDPDLTELPPPTGCQYALFFDPLHDDEPINGSGFQAIVTNSDGTVSFQTNGSQYLSQEPGQKGVFHLAGAIGPYEKFGQVGNIVTSWTRPASGDPIYSYVLGRLPNAA